MTDNSEQALDLREASLHLLEFDQVRERVARYASFPPAREMALQLAPVYDPAEVAQRQTDTAEARLFLQSGGALDLTGAKDLTLPLQRAALGGTLTGEELRDIHDTVKACRVARTAVLKHKGIPTLTIAAEGLPVLRDLERELGSSISDTGEMMDTASPTLRELREQGRDAYQSLTESLERTVRRMQRQNVLQEPIVTQRNGRMVVLVKTEMKHRLQGIVHDVSDSGATIFVEPMAAIGLGNLWRELRLAEEREEERVLRALSAKVETHHLQLLLGVEVLTRLDFALAKARYAEALNGSTPAIIEGERQYISLVGARHPLLEGKAVPIDLTVGDMTPVLLITGPNAGGKTVGLKTIGLLTLMAQAGLQVPAREATLSLFDGVYSDIGDQQSIERSMSTFSSHIENLHRIMGRATNRSLVLIDELGTSTDPEEGAALAKATINHFAGRGVTLVATTHHRDVAAYVQEQPAMVNASVELDPRSLAPTYRLSLGLPGRSYALTIAASLGLAREVVEEAQSLLGPTHAQAEGLLKELQEERHLAAEQRLEAEAARREAEERSAELDEQLSQVRDQKALIVEEARHQLQRGVEDLSRRLRAAERAVERAAPQVARSAGALPAPSQPLPPMSVDEAQAEVAEVRKELQSEPWQPLPSRRGDWMEGIRAGDRVYLRGIPQPVEVITPTDAGGTVEVLLGTMRARLPSYQLDRPAPAHTTSAGAGVFYARTARRAVDPQLTLRGVKVEEALERLEGYLSDAVMAGLSSVRIEHGVGTGALRAAVREHLNHHSLVRSYRPDENARTDGVTLVELA